MNKKDINVTEATHASISLVAGDEIVDSQDNKETVVYIDNILGNVIVGTSVIAFSDIASGDYQQVIGD